MPLGIFSGIFFSLINLWTSVFHIREEIETENNKFLVLIKQQITY